MRRALWILETVLIILFSIPLTILPNRLALKAGELLGLLLFYIWGSRRRIAIENIKKTGVRSQESGVRLIAKETFKNFGRSFVEIIKIYYGFGDKFIENVEVKGIDNYQKAKSKNRGVIFIAGHCGNWELMAIAFSSKVSRVGVIARPLSNPYLNRLIEKARMRYGNSVIYKKGALKNILSTLKGGGSVGILMDQSIIPSEGYVIDFLGRGAWTTKMPALIARKTGSPVLPIFIMRKDKGHIISIGAEIELSMLGNQEEAVIEDTKRFSGFIEEYIRQNPSEWLWIHRRWKRVKE